MTPLATSEAGVGGWSAAVRAAEAAGTAFLVLRDAAGGEAVRPLVGAAPVSIGRHAGCELPLPGDEMVSSTHALLERIGQAWTVADEGLSRNGTFLNGERLSSRRRLVDGDVIRVGRTTLLFRDPVASVMSPTVPDVEQRSEPLTAAQRRVLIELCRPFKERGAFATPASNAEIARALVVSVDAVKTQMRALFVRFAVGDLPHNVKRARLVERAFETGAVTERDL